MRLRWKDVEVISWCANMEFNLKGEEVEETIEGVAIFIYLGWYLDQSDDEWPAVRRNIGKAQQVWGILGTNLRWYGADRLTPVAFYRAVVPEVLRFIAETWVISTAMEKRLAGVHKCF